MPPTIVTLGVYGFDADGFLAALRRAQVEVFCDLRLRRGVRGKAYAFANRRRLEGLLAEAGIRYRHFKELAPDRDVRARQHAADRAQRTAKRQRAALSPEFVAGYQAACLAAFDSRRFLEALGPETRVAALFCVERSPAACHRSLVAERLRADLGCEIVHLLPD